jgi:hypothetical protein
MENPMTRIHALVVGAVALLGLSAVAVLPGCLAPALLTEDAHAATLYTVTCYAGGGPVSLGGQPAGPVIASSLQVRDNTNSWVITLSGSGQVITTSLSCQSY